MSRESRFRADGTALPCPPGHWGAAAPALPWYMADALDDIAADRSLPGGLAVLEKATGRCAAQLPEATRGELRGWWDEVYRWAGYHPAG